MKTSLALAAALASSAAPAAQAAGWKHRHRPQRREHRPGRAVRTADGVLHVAWHKDGDLFHTRSRPDGKVGATTPIQSGWASMSDPALTAVPGGLRAFWGGIRTTDPTETNQDLNTAFSTDGGATWALQTGSVVPLGAQAYGSDTSATTLPNGTTLQSWSGTLGTWVHAGSTRPRRTSTTRRAGGYGNDPGTWRRRERRGDAGLVLGHAGARHPRAGRRRRRRARGRADDDARHAGDGRRPGALAHADRRAAEERRLLHRPRRRLPDRQPGARVAGRRDRRRRCWPRPSRAPRPRSPPDAKGRLWVAGRTATFGDKHVYVARSNEDADALRRAGRRRRGQGRPLDLLARRQRDRLGRADVLAVFGIGDGLDAATYVTRVLPGPDADGASAQAHGRRSPSPTPAIRCKGAKVKAGGKSGKTDSKGRVELDAQEQDGLAGDRERATSLRH